MMFGHPIGHLHMEPWTSTPDIVVGCACNYVGNGSFMMDMTPWHVGSDNKQSIGDVQSDTGKRNTVV
jgi:hypothetical protein